MLESKARFYEQVASGQKLPGISYLNILHYTETTIPKIKKENK